MRCPPRSSGFDLPNNIWWCVQIMKLPTVQLSLFSRPFIPLRSKYSPQFPIQKTPSVYAPSLMLRPSSTIALSLNNNPTTWSWWISYCVCNTRNSAISTLDKDIILCVTYVATKNNHNCITMSVPSSCYEIWHERLSYLSIFEFPCMSNTNMIALQSIWGGRNINGP
jgi:hypothetical protein